MKHMVNKIFLLLVLCLLSGCTGNKQTVINGWNDSINPSIINDATPQPLPAFPEIILEVFPKGEVRLQDLKDCNERDGCGIKVKFDTFKLGLAEMNDVFLPDVIEKMCELRLDGKIIKNSVWNGLYYETITSLDETVRTVAIGWDIKLLPGLHNASVTYKMRDTLIVVYAWQFSVTGD